MNIDEAFPSKYLKASDLKNRRVTVTIDHVVMEPMVDGGENKPVVYFAGAQKGLVLNVTNKNVIREAYGFETDDWNGEQIVLFAAMVLFKGKKVPGLCVEIPDAPAVEPKPRAGGPKPLPHDEFSPPAADPDDEIPF